MSTLVRMDSDQGCFQARVDLGGGTVDGTTIKSSVGLGGRNLSADVNTVQQLLNSVTAANGGPQPSLAVDGLVGPKTIGAIQRFQRIQLGFADGRVDPAGPTLRRLNELSSARSGGRAVDFDLGARGKTSPARNPILEALRITLMVAAFPEVRQAIDKAISRTEAAINHVLIGPGGLTTTPDSFDFADKHFKLGNQSREATLADLQFIRTTFRRKKTILDDRPNVFGGPMFGRAILDIDVHPDKTPPKVKAYVPRSSVDHTGKTPHHIYLCAGLDGQPHDKFIHIMLHELGHFVDDEDPATVIEDHGYAFFGTLDGLSHDKRMHNADTYAIYAFENAFGRPRLKALFPRLK